MATKATHSGHCQACGRLQKLPGGLLSKHGYTVDHGYFSGVCHGAGFQPFEKAFDLLPIFIKRAEIHLDGLVKFQAELSQPVTGRRAWVHNYEGYRYGYNEYRWIEVDVIVTEREQVNGGYEWQGKSIPRTVEIRRDYSYVANGTNGKTNVTHKINDYAYGAQPEVEFITGLNIERAKSLDNEVKSLRRYIVWQKDRIATWKEADLYPVEHKDKEGFDPEAK